MNLNLNKKKRDKHSGLFFISSSIKLNAKHRKNRYVRT